ncbi:MAG: MucB/RseB C-terminal domain-containing protein [Porticoccaceae bacterium]|nr:MucB/RseB C-terminal domain-containing protein [Porticoccaceae bacterium]MDG1308498.1 MucB/RseB C-terminal domain-containing protein [Porticoccaceae bacterium]
MLVKWLTQVKLAALLAAVFVHGPLISQQMDSAYDLMARMAKASKELSYSGLFTYEFRDNLTSVKVEHVVRDGETYERIVYMDGPEREIVRRGENINCMRASDMLLRGSALKINDNTYAHLQDFYNFYIRGDARIAGRQVSVVNVIPKDKYRYGYVIAIDKETGLMLQSVLINRQGKPMERFQFVDVSIGTQVNDIEFSSELIDSADIGADQSDCLEGNQQAKVSESRWTPRWLPAGFVLSSYQPAGTDGQESLMYTDGLAVFSVFIDSSSKIRNLPKVDANLGATVAVLTNTEFNDQRFAICVVGEIPRSTASQIANAIAPIPARPMQ